MGANDKSSTDNRISMPNKFARVLKPENSINLSELNSSAEYLQRIKSLEDSENSNKNFFTSLTDDLKMN